MRFSGDAAFAEFFPGILHSAIKPAGRPSRLPASGIPEQARRSDPNLIYAPLVAIEFEEFSVSVSERSIVVGVKLPYQGWENFQRHIATVVKLAEESQFIQHIERFSLKYTNVVEPSDDRAPIRFTTAKIAIGDDDLDNERFDLRVERNEDEFIKIRRLVSSVDVTLNHSGFRRSGILVEADTIINSTNEKPIMFATIHARLNELRLVNKQDFFAMLSDQTIESLGPQYG